MLKSISLVLAAGLFLGCGANANAQIRVGAPFALTGPVGELAREMRKGAELAMAQVNEQGGLLASRYQLLFADTACDPGRAVSAVRALIEESEVLALVGPVCSGATLRQAQSVSIPAGVVTLSVASASSLITRLNDNDLVFRTAPSDDLKGEAMARVAYETGIREIAISHATDAYNTGIAAVFAAAFEAIGGRVVLRQSHQPNQGGYQREGQAAANAAANIALFAYYGSGGLEYLDALFKTGRVAHVIATDGLMSKEMDKKFAAEDFARLTIVKAAADHDRSAYKHWAQFADAAGVKPAGPYVANAYDAAFLMALAIEAAGNADRAKIAKALRAVSGPPGVRILPGEFAKARALLQQGQEIDYDGASGPVDFDAAGDIAGRVSVNRFADGSWHEKMLD
ncbi:MAG: ABC transporter substrate-binding protein [Novosphingobium sp.]|nr:ABC transporter substrate-binding protein [Novosphingobium sp.]